LVMFNTRPNVLYVHLDQLLFDLKYDPSVLEIPVPRYFKEDDRLQVDIKWKEEVKRDKKKKPKKKKKKKKKAVEEEVPKIPMSWTEKSMMIDSLLENQSHWRTAEPEEEIVKDPFTLDMDIISAIRLVQKNERGRQGRSRYVTFQKKKSKEKKHADRQKLIKEGIMKETNQEQQEAEGAIFIQKRLKGILARKKIEEMRLEEMVFLGMSRKQPTKEEMAKDPLKLSTETEIKRKRKQVAHSKNLRDAREQIIEDIVEDEETDIMNEMRKERRDWITEWKETHNKKPPENFVDFYARFNVEENPDKSDDEEDDAKGKGKGKGKDAGKGKGGKGKKGGDDDDEGVKALETGITEVV
jgi:hypothetical protein